MKNWQIAMVAVAAVATLGFGTSALEAAHGWGGARPGIVYRGHGRGVRHYVAPPRPRRQVYVGYVWHPGYIVDHYDHYHYVPEHYHYRTYRRRR